MLQWLHSCPNLSVHFSLQNFDVERDKQGRPVGFGGRSVRSNERSGGGGGGSMNNHSNWNDPPMNNQSGGNKYGNTYGLSPQFLESLWIQGPLTNKIFVANVSIFILMT